MCGICGKVSWDEPVDVSLVQRMMDMLVHRGPDDEGMYVEQQVVLGHRRLSIIDLNTGKQPISNEDGTVWIVFNGEIYNFVQLRDELLQAGHRFQTQTDTEVIVHLYEQYGEHCVDRLSGMFAFAIWDVRKKKLFLARDRVGIKPLYYSVNEKSVIFASEIKALMADPSVKREIDLQTIDKFLTFFYTPGPETMFRSIRKLPPGHYLICEDGKFQLHQYWDLTFTGETRKWSLNDTTAELVDLLRETVRSHMISDVPVGVLLSGGVDSTGLLSFCPEATNKKVKTFTIGFGGEQFADERTYARLAAQRYGTEHYEMTISPEDFRDFMPTYVRHMEEPVCEPPAIALYYITRLASEHVKVLISGEGGDEAFAGYQKYRNVVWLERIKQLGWPWAGGAELMLNGLSSIGASRFTRYAALMQIPLEEYYYSCSAGPQSPFVRLREELYAPGFRTQIDPERSLQYIHDCFSAVRSGSPLNKMLYVDTKSWLPDDLLVKADKMTMANSVELRVPFLDHKVLEFAASLPTEYKLKGLTTKYILKRALNGRVPEQVINRKKAGFPVPLQSWFTGELKDFSRDVLFDSRTLARGYFRKNAIESLLQQAEKERMYGKEIFSLIVLELWHREFVDGGLQQRAENKSTGVQ
jgi:asparagine synthase (glutamine-hydrolysing)